MNVIHIALYRFYSNMKDYKYLLLLLLAPLLTIFLTGSNTIKTENQYLKVNICYYNEDKGIISQKFDDLLSSDDVKKSLNIKYVSSYNDGLDLVKSGESEAFIYIAEGFSKELQNGSGAKINVLGNKDLSYAKLLVQGFENTINSYNAIILAGGVPASEKISPPISETGITRTLNTPTGMDNWTYLNMMLFLFYGGFIGSFSVINGIRKKTITRMNTAPVGLFTDAAGQFLGNVVTMFLCASLVMVVTKFAYGSNWNGDIGIILVTFLLYSMISISIGMITGYLSKKPAISILVVVCLNLFLGNAGISYVVGYMTGIFKWISYISPHYYGYLIISGTIFGGTADKIQSSLIALILGAGALTLMTMVLGRRRQV